MAIVSYQFLFFFAAEVDEFVAEAGDEVQLSCPVKTSGQTIFLASFLDCLHSIYSMTKSITKYDIFIFRMWQLPLVEVVPRHHPSVRLQPYCRLQECRRYSHG